MATTVFFRNHYQISCPITLSKEDVYHRRIVRLTTLKGLNTITIILKTVIHIYEYTARSREHIAGLVQCCSNPSALAEWWVKLCIFYASYLCLLEGNVIIRIRPSQFCVASIMMFTPVGLEIWYVLTILSQMRNITTWHISSLRFITFHSLFFLTYTMYDLVWSHVSILYRCYAVYVTNQVRLCFEEYAYIILFRCSFSSDTYTVEYWSYIKICQT